MSRGDHIYVMRPLGYTHHGIDCGDGTVIHFTGEPGKNKSDASVARTPIADFALDGIIHLREYSSRSADDEVIGRAESRLGSKDYHLVTNNCEHFATWCCTGRIASQQVRLATSLTSSSAAISTAAATTASVVGAVGSVAGVSGAGIMSGLATAGGVVGGGAAMGPAALAFAPAVVSVGAVQVALRSDKSLPKSENDARRDGRIASVAGAGAATIGGFAAIGAAGTTAGLSAAGISSGLAAIGAAVGGGMLAGTVTVVAAPALAAGAAGFGIYAASRRLRGIRQKKWAPPTPELDPVPAEI